MKHLFLFFQLFFFLHTGYSEVREIKVTPNLQISLLNDKGQKTGILSINTSENWGQAIFKSKINLKIRNFQSWGLEIYDLNKVLKFQKSGEGKPPELIHWNEPLTEFDKLKDREKFFFRLIVISTDNDVFASDWSVFDLQKVKGEELKTSKDEREGLAVSPTWALNSIYLSTKNESSLLIPSLLGQIRVHGSFRHSFGLIYETTLKEILNETLSSNHFSFSSLSIFYQMRLGSRKYNNESLPFLKGSFYGPFSVGLRSFHSMSRGQSGSTIHNELFHSASGFSLSGHFDKKFRSFKLSSSGELGYSILRGKLLTLFVETKLYYEKWNEIKPGFALRYLYLSGRREDTTEVTNRLLFAGLLFEIEV